MTVTKVTVPRDIKEAGGTHPVIAQTSMVFIITGSTYRLLMESTGFTGKDTTTL